MRGDSMFVCVNFYKNIFIMCLLFLREVSNWPGLEFNFVELLPRLRNIVVKVNIIFRP